MSNSKGTQVKSKAHPQRPAPPLTGKVPCPRQCNLVPVNVPGPQKAQLVLHPKKDVFVLKVAKVGPKGDRKCKMELELVTPKGPEKKVPVRLDTRETQCETEPPPCCCAKTSRRKKK